MKLEDPRAGGRWPQSLSRERARFTRAALAGMALVAALILGGCGGTSDPTSATEPSDFEKRNLHGRAELGTRGVAILGPGSSSATRTLQVQARGLRPTEQNSYTVWLSATPRQMLMLGSFELESGRD